MKSMKLISTLMFFCAGSWITANAEDITLKDQGNVTVESYTDANVRVEGKTNLFLTGESPLANSTVELTGENAWLYFESIRPSKVLDSWTKYVKVDGRDFDKQKDRIAIYASGAVIIPNGLVTAEQALTVYTGKNFSGKSKSFEVYTYHNDLKEFDNKVRSFKLKRGFSCTLANNPDGTGFSRYFIAGDEDIEFAEMPEGLEFVSFIRVFKWEWPAKKGWAGTPGEQLNVSTFNTWGGGVAEPNMDSHFEPMRHNAGWDSWEVINAQTEVTTLLGFNEPDRPDQSNMKVEDAIGQWPDFFKSGLRIGSPAPASTNNWLKRFMEICDSLNYRVDFMVTHAYQYQNTGWWDWYIDVTSRGNRSIEEAGVYRPVWITEYNNGANWTTESWPTAEGPQRDANLEIIKDENGNEINVRRPLSPENSEKQVNKMKEMLPYFDKSDLLEHYYLYNWVQDARSMELNGVLTPAGKVFAAHKSIPGFKQANAYAHKWRIAPPWILSGLSADYTQFNLDWYDHNGETGIAYVLQRKESDGEFETVRTYKPGVDYQYGDTVKYTETVGGKDFDKVVYRVYAVSYKQQRSIYSRELAFVRDSKAVAPALKGEAVSSTIVKLGWPEGTNARSYRLERAEAEDGNYETIADLYADTTWVDKDLNDNKDYYYRIYSLNSAGESEASDILHVKTKTLQTPEASTGLRASGGDKTVTLTWDFVYDAVYDILRAETEDGEYVEIATDVVVPENNANYTDAEGLEYDKTYYYKIRPHNAAGTAEESVAVSAVPGVAQVLHLDFMEGEGNMVYDRWGGYHAELKNSPVWNRVTVNETERPAVFLSTENKSYLELPEGVVSHLDTTFTIASWLYLPEEAGNNTRMFDFGNGESVFMVFIPKYDAAGQARYKLTYLKEDGTSVAFQPTFAYNFPLGQWAHVAFTVQKHPQGGLAFTCYLNGERVYTDRDHDYVIPSGMGVTPNNWLGRSQWARDPYCAHGYSDFRIYNQALGRNDVRRLYNGEPLEDLDRGPSAVQSLESDNEMLVSVAPNPAIAGEQVFVSMTNTNVEFDEMLLEVYDLVGNCVSRNKVSGSFATMTAPSVPGTYIVRLSADGFSKGEKLLVK